MASAMRMASSYAVIALVLASGACSHEPTAIVPTSLRPSVQQIEAGVAGVDITPPPGLSLFGHGPEGRVSIGWRLRLRCRAFVVIDPDSIAALLPCDLAAPSLALQRRVAAKLAEDGVPIAANRLFLMATHTHAGPAHYFTQAAYAGTFSTREPGFDPEVLEWLADRMADAVERAYHAREPVQIKYGGLLVAGLTRNRSLGAFFANAGAMPRRFANLSNLRFDQEGTADTTNAAPGTCDLAEGCDPASRAVDRLLTVVRFDSVASAKTLGVLAIFGMHPTAFPNTNEVYHGDVFGFASRWVEDQLRDPEGSGAPLVGIANGIEGDVSPAWSEQSEAEARRLGRRLGKAILKADLKAAKPAESLDVAYRDLSLPSAVASTDPVTHLCRQPEIGVAAVGGAEDGPTTLRIFPVAHEGSKAPGRKGCHAPRLALVGPLGRMQAGRDMPDVAPIGLVRLGGLALAFVPAEVTTVAGVRMANHLKRHLAGTDHVALIGLTNEYVEYVATAEEFKAQHYEGASTIYGPATAKLLENHLVCLADHLSHVAAKCLPQRFEIDRLGVTRVEPQVPSTSRMPPDVEDCTQDFNALITPEKHHENGVRGWRISWQGEPPGYARTPHRLWIEVQRQLPQGWTKLDDDSGSNMEVTYEYDEHRDAHMWHAEWRPLAVRGEQCMDYRFVVHARSTHTSTAFTFCGRLVEIDRSSEAP